VRGCRTASWATSEFMSVINVQESFLNIALAGGKHITVHLLNGAKVSGNVRSFDKYSIVLETNTQEQLIFKHSVSALLVCCKNKRCTEQCLPVPKAVE
jgi:RNA chaperone Hfq